LASAPALHLDIDAALDAIPEELLDHSGRVFYSGHAAFSVSSDLYILGLNPGGDPLAQAVETIGADLLKFRNCWFSTVRYDRRCA
jgi:hypothetical protein